MSLKDLMNFLIADFENIPDDPWDAMPAYRQKHFGVKTFASLVKHLTEQDLGDSFNVEWSNRFRKLMRYLKITGRHVPLLLRRYL